MHERIVSLGVEVSQWRIVDGLEEPLARYADDTLELAANNRHVLETAAACAANTAWSADALDALAAHCVTVLNVALADITDATEARAIGKLLG